MSEYSRNIKWGHIAALVALDVAISISWIAYHKYQPNLLDQFGYADKGLYLAIIQGIVLLLTPPAAGYIADRIRQKRGERLPVINVGINVVSMVFMVVALTVFADPNGTLSALFPVLIVLWLISMNVFHSPAISTVEMFVPPTKLPQAMAVLAVAMDVTQALEPSIVDLIEFFGGPVTFAVGGILVFGTGWWFSRMVKRLPKEEIAEEHGAHGHEHHDHGHDHNHDHDHGHDHDHSHDHGHLHANPRSNFPLVFILGLGLGVAMTCFFDLFPDWAENARTGFIGASGMKGSFFISLLVIGAALLSYPISIFAERQGVQKTALAGALLSAFLIFGLANSTGWIATAMFSMYPIAFATISVTFLPIAFMSLGTKYKVLGVGIFFSGVELAGSVVDVLQAM